MAIQTNVCSIPEIPEVNTLRVRFKVKATDGVEVSNVVYMTVHKVPH